MCAKPRWLSNGIVCMLIGVHLSHIHVAIHVQKVNQSKASYSFEPKPKKTFGKSHMVKAVSVCFSSCDDVKNDWPYFSSYWVLVFRLLCLQKMFLWCNLEFRASLLNSDKIQKHSRKNKVEAAWKICEIVLGYLQLSSKIKKILKENAHLFS